MSIFNFPPLRLGVMASLIQLKERVDADPDFLKTPDCPYDAETVRAIYSLFAPKVIEKIVEVEVERVDMTEKKAGRGRPTKDVLLSSEDQEKVADHIKKLMEELDKLGDGEQTLEVSEKIQIMKTKAALTSELLKMQERVLNIKRMSDFQEVVIGILQDLVSEDGRQVFLKRIDPYR